MKRTSKNEGITKSIVNNSVTDGTWRLAKGVDDWDEHPPYVTLWHLAGDGYDVLAWARSRVEHKAYEDAKYQRVTSRRAMEIVRRRDVSFSTMGPFVGGLNINRADFIKAIRATVVIEPAIPKWLRNRLDGVLLELDAMPGGLKENCDGESILDYVEGTQPKRMKQEDFECDVVPIVMAECRRLGMKAKI